MDPTKVKDAVVGSKVFKDKIAASCKDAKVLSKCEAVAEPRLFCALVTRSKPDVAKYWGCGALKGASLLQIAAVDNKHRAPEDELAKEMTHDLEMNFNKIAPFGKEDTAKELQDHAAKTQDTLVDAVENAEVA